MSKESYSDRITPFMPAKGETYENIVDGFLYKCVGRLAVANPERMILAVIAAFTGAENYKEIPETAAHDYGTRKLMSDPGSMAYHVLDLTESGTYAPLDIVLIRRLKHPPEGGGIIGEIIVYNNRNTPKRPEFGPDIPPEVNYTSGFVGVMP